MDEVEKSIRAKQTKPTIKTDQPPLQQITSKKCGSKEREQMWREKIKNGDEPEERRVGVR